MEVRGGKVMEVRGGKVEVRGGKVMEVWGGTVFSASVAVPTASGPPKGLSM